LAIVNLEPLKNTVPVPVDLLPEISTLLEPPLMASVVDAPVILTALPATLTPTTFVIVVPLLIKRSPPVAFTKASVALTLLPSSLMSVKRSLPLVTLINGPVYPVARCNVFMYEGSSLLMESTP
jgi:hypothetical protein